MRRVKLDKIDLRILKDLQENGRITNARLARNAGISAPPCLRRVKALEESGYIKGYSAEVDCGMLGYNVTVWAMVTLKSQNDSDLKEFEQWISKWDSIRECYMISGEIDFLLKILARDWDSYQQFLTDHLTSAPHVGKVKSSLAIRPTKMKAGAPIQVD